MMDFFNNYGMNPFPYNNVFAQIIMCFCGIIG